MFRKMTPQADFSGHLANARDGATTRLPPKLIGRSMSWDLLCLGSLWWLCRNAAAEAAHKSELSGGFSEVWQSVSEVLCAIALAKPAGAKLLSLCSKGCHGH